MVLRTIYELSFAGHFILKLKIHKGKAGGLKVKIQWEANLELD